MSFNDFWRVPPMWRGETVVCMATGPSMSPGVANVCRGRARVIAINDNYLLAPWADIHYFCDRKWFDWHKTGDHPAQRMLGLDRALGLFRDYKGIRVTIEPTAPVLEEDPRIKVLRNDSQPVKGKTHDAGGLCLEPDGIRTGRNSGFQAINLAVHTGAKRILLVGYDMRAVDGKSHWFGDHPHKANARIYASTFIPEFRTLIEPLGDLGIEMINCTPRSALEAFPKTPLETALCR